MSSYRRSRERGATFFFTVTLAERTSSALVAQIELLRVAYRRVARRRPFETIAICVLPDHLHAVWKLPEGDRDFSGRWSAIKSQFSRGLPEAKCSPSKRARREKGIWQRRFWEHQICDEIDLERHVDYIHYNPVKHRWALRVADWPHSSFHRYVRQGLRAADWGGAGTNASVGADFGEP